MSPISGGMKAGRECRARGSVRFAAARKVTLMLVSLSG
jgi:hypothetical protein